MKINNDAELKKIVDICRRFPTLEIDAVCEDKRYLVDAKAFQAMRLLKGGGEVYFKVISGEEDEAKQFVEALKEVSLEMD